ncbi:hypothetical protein D8M30_15825 [Corynebacterium pseudodiphtheriticum]|nr:hypothetical protein D8M30_15825 [Corynebacterium pseudodiphtheriticum]
MVVELIGGPLDGTVIDGNSHMPLYMVVTSHEEGPIYRAGCCGRCAAQAPCMPYYFLGYEQNIRYAYPEKCKDIEAFNQESAPAPDSQSRS